MCQMAAETACVRSEARAEGMRPNARVKAGLPQVRWGVGVLTKGPVTVSVTHPEEADVADGLKALHVECCALVGQVAKGLRPGRRGGRRGAARGLRDAGRGAEARHMCYASRVELISY